MHREIGEFRGNAQMVDQHLRSWAHDRYIRRLRQGAALIEPVVDVDLRLLHLFEVFLGKAQIVGAPAVLCPLAEAVEHLCYGGHSLIAEQPILHHGMLHAVILRLLIRLDVSRKQRVGVGFCRRGVGGEEFVGVLHYWLMGTDVCGTGAGALGGLAHPLSIAICMARSLGTLPAR